MLVLAVILFPNPIGLIYSKVTEPFFFQQQENAIHLVLLEWVLAVTIGPLLIVMRHLHTMVYILEKALLCHIQKDEILDILFALFAMRNNYSMWQSDKWQTLGSDGFGSVSTSVSEVC